MPVCSHCRGFTKYKNGLCKDCYTKEYKKSKETKNEKNSKFPSHTQLYKNLHLIRGELIEHLFHSYFTKKLNIKSMEELKGIDVHFQIEIDNWDIIITFEVPLTDERRIKLDIQEEFIDTYRHSFLIEYKSSISEWGKQVDQFFRQIKYREKQRDEESAKLVEHGIWDFSHPVLFSFDESFEEYREACRMAYIDLLIGPKDWLKLIEK